MKQIVAPRLRKRTESEASNASGDRPRNVHRQSSLENKKEDKKDKMADLKSKNNQSQQQVSGNRTISFCGVLSGYTVVI